KIYQEMGLIIKWVIIFLVIYYLTVFIVRIAMPFWRIYKQMNSPENKRMRDEFMNNMRNANNPNAQQNGNTTQTNKNRQQPIEVKEKEGDYIDFEEIK
ncbi:MAG: DUF4834 family protein, partial [Chitinophagales bacterium]|nr:DUF4834 family protein [Chitinophagales bacterium]